jgi:hypothetical protein
MLAFFVELLVDVALSVVEEFRAIDQPHELEAGVLPNSEIGDTFRRLPAGADLHDVAACREIDIAPLRF